MARKHEHPVSRATAEMIEGYHELNGPIDILHSEPSPLEFLRYVTKNRPFILRGGCSDWDAVNKWDATYLQQKMESRNVKVAMTPNG